MNDLSPGAVLSHRYRVVRGLGEGGLGAAFLVEDLLRGDRVALKIVRAPTPSALAAFAREFRQLRHLVHPYLLRVRDFGHDAGCPYYTADLVDGIDLRAHALELPWREAIAPLFDALAALRVLHRALVRHGDVKPENILVRRDGRGVLIDLSCAQAFGDVTALSGTPGYFAPEVAALSTADQRSDLYGVGATLAALAHGRGDVPKAASKLIARLMQQRPAKRPADVAEVVEVLGGELGPLQAPQREPSRLIGHADVLARFEALLSAVCAGEPAPRALVIAGAEEGIGRTRLLDEMKWIAAQHCGVVEGLAERADAVTSMLRRATGDAELPDDLSGVALARDLLGKQPLVLCLDDADRLDAAQATLWRGWLRSASERDPRLTVTTVRQLEAGARDDGDEAVATVTLDPLSEEDVATWIEGLLPRSQAHHVAELTGGIPLALQELTSRVSAGDVSARALSRLADGATISHKRLGRLGKLDRDTQLALATFALAGGTLDGDALASLGISPSILAALAGEGWLSPNAGGWRLTRRTDAPSVLAGIDDGEQAALHMALADQLSCELDVTDPSRQAGSLTAAVARHLWLGGALERARQLLSRSSASIAQHPDAWVDAARAMCSDHDGEVALLACEILEGAGQFDEAIAALARMLRRTIVDRHDIWTRAGATYLRCGQHQRALRYLLRAHATAGSDARRPRVADLVSRAHIKLGDYDAAKHAALDGLARAQSDADRANLHDDVGVAASYLGEMDLAREHLDQAAALHAQPRAQARAASYRALVAYRAGNTREALSGFQHALELAEGCGAADLVVYAAQNLGAACHQLGDLGLALASYERGSGMATALGDVPTEVALACNLAKLYSDVGLLDRARATAARAEARAERAHLPVFAATAASVIGEVLLLSGDTSAARIAFERARSGFGEDARREAAETWIHLADALDGDDPAAAARARAHARVLAKELAADDLEAKLGVSDARARLEHGDPSGSIGQLERALDAARRSGQRELEAEVLAWLARACNSQGAQLLAQRHASDARELWEQTAVRLPKHLAETFWAHPARQLPEPATQTLARDGSDDRARRLERLLDINKKLNSSLEAQQILAWTIDSALELTGAERGFVLLSSHDGQLAIEVARNIDPSAVPEQTRFSQSIAQQVIDNQGPVITVDAERDERFEQQHSVHAMHLKSVVCVPIIATQGVIGAVYLDHRYKRGVFGSDQVDLLAAFADQVAIALTNARLHQELAERSRQLDAIMRGQAEQIEDLTARVRVQQRALMHRYDYGAIIGDSPGMQRVFGMLDRVIDSDVPVLIQGESGTGKELIAKAIHYNGARKDGPMVSINCGALPEPLLESELFGYVRGAFTGATTDREGLFVAARGGTVFLDEVGEMPASMQVKLLRVLQEQEVTPLGQSRAVPIDARLVAATNRQLRREVDQGRFREDLYYRIGVVEIEVPPLRQRRGDIPLLVDRLLSDAAERLGRSKPSMSQMAMRRLEEHPWPGNVRELENAITKAVLLADDGVVKPDALELAPRAETLPRSRVAFQGAEAEQLLALLHATGWNVSETARRMGLSRPTIYRKIERYGFAP